MPLIPEGSSAALADKARSPRARASPLIAGRREGHCGKSVRWCSIDREMPLHVRPLDKAVFLPLLRPLWTFIKREWTTVFIWSAIGVLSAATIRLIGSDAEFRQYCIERYRALRAHYGGLHSYSAFLVASAIAAALAVLPSALTVLWKGIRSWALGVTSGFCLISFLLSFLSFAFLHSDLRLALLFNVLAIGIAFCISFVLYWLSLTRIRSLPSESEIRVSDSDLLQVGTSILSSDDPIASWAQDLLDRAPVVDSVSFSLLISRTPVLALLGRFGSGKSSILNLLAKHLSDKAVVVSFSTWLPGSGDTLSSYLLEDISKECRKLYVAPGIRRSARKLALALAKRVPLLDSLFDSLSVLTQRDEIEMLGEAVARLPRRVVVLLDEVDRMGKPELEALLKVLRGLSLSSNLSFVCAFDRETVEKTAREKFDSSSNIYFEKFFPVSVNIPVIDEGTLKEIGVRRLTSALDRRGWFETEKDRETYEEKIGELWPDLLSPFCSTIRRIGLLANDVAAASYLKGEIDLIDLTLIELLRRFEPAIHEIVWRFRETFSEGEHSLAWYRFSTDEQRETKEKQLAKEVDDALQGSLRAGAAKEVLGRLFPNFERVAQLRLRPLLSRPKADELANTISDPSIMRAYFHQKLAEDDFSSRKMREFVRELEHAGSPETLHARVLRTIESMEKGNPKRRDFLRKLSTHLKNMDLSVATEVVHTCMGAAGRFAYDIFVAVGEAGDALRMVMRVAERKTDHSECVAFMGKCILEAEDDTMALRILTVLSKPGQDFNLHVSFAELYPYFIEHMTEKYGPSVDPRKVDLSCSDRDAFNLWGFADLSKEGVALDPQEVTRNRAIQRDFWLGYIGTSRKRLAEAVSQFFFYLGHYEGDPRPIIENKIPVTDLRQLYESTDVGQALTTDDRVSLGMLGRLLEGEFARGVGPFEWENERQRIIASEQGGDRNAADH